MLLILIYGSRRTGRSEKLERLNDPTPSFYQKLPDLHVAAGSLLDFELERISFPVGRVEFYYLYPMSFGEFLNAIKKTL